MKKGRGKTAKNPQTGKNFKGGGEYFSGWPEYIPLHFRYRIV